MNRFVLENPWLFGAVTVATWIVVYTLAGSVFGEPSLRRSLFPATAGGIASATVLYYVAKNHQ
ncbi:hypothetical protein OB955_12650 [Halobacteria archaeon AArc-m2/3/4]|uniref:Uncharacterized protein n=1 Tax=Natronoglomus mannanivorans TaxID=2979990 RepID=A0AAP2YXC0_9EURY|nr:hypothetical protein [Halobacteria archaeon AArc-xg1-1]MCU4973586.1 hypothetical protein [Halobacteria archaeon AArc-m2/3/4]